MKYVVQTLIRDGKIAHATLGLDGGAVE